MIIKIIAFFLYAILFSFIGCYCGISLIAIFIAHVIESSIGLYISPFMDKLHSHIWE